MNKKSQVWTLDYVIGMLIFIVLFMISIGVIMSMLSKDKFEPVYRDATHLSDTLMSSGVPVIWNSSNVIVPGILENDSKSRINVTKLNQYDTIDYQHTKTLFRINNEYLFFFKNSTAVINVSGCTHGYPIAVDAQCNPLLDTIKYDNLAKIERVVILNSTIRTMVIYVWR